MLPGQSMSRKREKMVKTSNIVYMYLYLQLQGNKRADVHMRGRQTLSSDHIVEMIPPIWTLGKEFLTSTTFERKGDLFRIVGK